jgi:hypothetical protein
MNRACRMDGEKRNVYVTGGKARREETTRKTKT